VTPEQEAVILKLGRDRVLAHQVLFKHRHPDPTPEFHASVINMWHSRDPYGLCMVFREGGKSTIAEEAFVIGAGYQLFHNALIIGSTEKRACERLRAIKHEIEHNEMVQLLFSRLVGSVWNEAEIILSNGVRIIAVGRGQSLRGTKHLHYRPDFCFCDDIEESENVNTPEARDETLSWFMRVVIPAMDKHGRIRVNATPLDREALPFQLQKRLKWPCQVFPIEYIDEKGDRQPTWGARYPLSWIDAKKAAFESVGKLDDYMREYMCVAEDPKQKIFTQDMFKVEPRVRTWHPTWAMLDPARTTKATSAFTGWAVWSWISNRLVVWDGDGDFWKPDEIVSKVFAVDDEFSPIIIGVEEDGLNEFLMQPLRQEMTRRGIIVPVKAMKAPKGKHGFIAGLQPFALAKEITFAKDLPGLKQQFLNFPTGRIDAPNALAYALIMRPGQTVYEDFGASHVVDDILAKTGPAYLCLGARGGLVTGILAQFKNGVLSILADYVREGDPGCIGEIVQEARLVAREIKLVAGPEHFGAFNHLGLRGSVAKIPAELQRGAAYEVGRDEIRTLLRQRLKDEPTLKVSMKAKWTLNAFSAGYAYAISKDGSIRQEATEGVYRVLMEGLEAFTGLLKGSTLNDSLPNYQRTASGQRYISALPGQMGVKDAKGDILAADNRSDLPLFARR
jgi:hypothetical protein